MFRDGVVLTIPTPQYLSRLCMNDEIVCSRLRDDAPISLEAHFETLSKVTDIGAGVNVLQCRPALSIECRKGLTAITETTFQSGGRVRSGKEIGSLSLPIRLNAEFCTVAI
jgi:hypothetical protein